MNNIVKTLIFCSFLIMPVDEALPQLSSNAVFISSVVDLQKNITRLSDEISVYEKKILKNENTVSNSGRILKLARENNNKEAERISSEAIMTSEKTISECRNFIVILNNKKKQYESALASVKKSLASDSALTDKIKAVSLRQTGRVAVTKQNGDQYELKSGQNQFLENGDIITTGNDGMVDLKFLEGRGSVTVGPDSKIKMLNENDSTAVMEVMKGKIYSGIIKADEYEKKMVEMYQDFSADSLLNSFSQFNSMTPEQRTRFIRNNVLKLFRKEKFEVRTPSAICGIRGTHFSIRVPNANTTELQVIEGKVEVTSVSETMPAMVCGGQSCIINKNGGVPLAVQTDTLNFNKWWEDEE